MFPLQLLGILISFQAILAASIQTDRGVVIKVKPSDITYYFCSKNNAEGIPIKYYQVNTTKSVFDPKKETFIQIHGWLDGDNSAFNSIVKNAVLSTRDVNLIVVDWSKVAVGEYIMVKSQTTSVGKYFGEFLANLTSTFKYPVSKIKLVGHSLGAHIAGFVGKSFRGKIDQIVGLDPAGPLMSQKASDRLDKGDAQFVEVIHTSSGKTGMGLTIGHADFFPNGGKAQPGCNADLIGKCAHLRSFYLYAESLKNNGFYAQKCSNYKDFETHQCKGATTFMGGYDVDRKASGEYFLDTNAKSPYAKGKI